MPSWELFEKQPQDYRAEVLLNVGTCVRRAGSTLGWSRVGPNGICLGMKTFGASAPTQQLQQKFFTAERVARPVKGRAAHGRADGGVIVMELVDVQTSNPLERSTFWVSQSGSIRSAGISSTAAS